MATTVKWLGPLPNCEACKMVYGNIVPASYDARTKAGPWAYLCVTCFNEHGVGLGLGLGQKLVSGTGN